MGRNEMIVHPSGADHISGSKVGAVASLHGEEGGGRRQQSRGASVKGVCERGGEGVMVWVEGGGHTSWGAHFGCLQGCGEGAVRW